MNNQNQDLEENGVSFLLFFFKIVNFPIIGIKLSKLYSFMHFSSKKIYPANLDNFPKLRKMTIFKNGLDFMRS